ncbi:hypothetical protein D3C85_1526580 [compost metagenome]
MVSVLPFRSTRYSSAPILAVPPGRTRFWALIALTTSRGDRPRACNAGTCRSTVTCRTLPPYGRGMEAPCTVASWVRMKLFPRSYSSCSGSVSLPSASRRMGTVEAL